MDFAITLAFIAIPTLILAVIVIRLRPRRPKRRKTRTGTVRLTGIPPAMPLPLTNEERAAERRKERERLAAAAENQSPASSGGGGKARVPCARCRTTVPPDEMRSNFDAVMRELGGVQSDHDPLAATARDLMAAMEAWQCDRCASWMCNNCVATAILTRPTRNIPHRSCGGTFRSVTPP